jgi:molybdopterin converting factor small subunit
LSDTTWTIRLFGGFRRFGTDIAVTAPEGTHARALKARLAQQLARDHGDLGATALVALSALASDREVLDDLAIPAPGSRLAILPPVSGG